MNIRTQIYLALRMALHVHIFVYIFSVVCSICVCVALCMYRSENARGLAFNSIFVVYMQISYDVISYLLLI